MSPKQEKFLIGLTGNIGTGKSVVRRMLGHLGAYGIDADALGHRAIMKGAPGYQSVVDTFGHWILDKDGNIDRRKLAKIVFEDPSALDELESIVHPLVSRAIDILVQRTPHQIVVVEAIKLFESDLVSKCDTSWVTYTPEAMQVQRLTERRGMSDMEALSRIKQQSSQKKKISQADLVIVNDSSFEKVWKQVYSAWNKLSVNVTAEREAEIAATESTISTDELLRVKRATPAHANEIAKLLNEIGKPALTYDRMAVMESFGEKAFLLLYDNPRDELIGVLSWQVENLVARVYDIFLKPDVPEAAAVMQFLKRVEDDAKSLQAEMCMLFMDKNSELSLKTFPSLGYDRSNADDMESSSWIEAAKDPLGKGKLLFVKELRTDRVLKPL
jgi:dephospho-CoA kinase